MSDGNKTKFRVMIDKCPDELWNIGVTFSHMGDETYLHIGLFKWSINIGIMYEDYCFVDEF
jgi:hypothetical protein